MLDTYSGTLVEFKDEKIVVLPPENITESKNKAKVKIEIITSLVFTLEHIACT